MLSDRSSAPTLLGCRPSAQKSLGCSKKRFQLLTKSSFCFLHHDNNHSFKANSLLNLSCPRRYVGRGPDTMIVVAGDVLCTVSIRLLKSLFSVSVCRSLVSFTPACSTTAPTLSSSFRIGGISAETLRTRAPGKQCVCTLPSANVARTCRTMESPTIIASRSVSWRGAKRFWVEISKTGSGGGGDDVARGLARVFRCCHTQGPVQRNTRSRGGGSVSSVLYTYPGPVSVSPGCFQRSLPFSQLGLSLQQLVDLLLHGLQLQLHRMQLERVLTCTQR